MRFYVAIIVGLLAWGTNARADDKLTFTERFSAFPAEAAEQETEAIEVPVNVVDYFTIFAPDIAAESALRLTLAVRRAEVGFGVVVDIDKLATIIRYESRANSKAVNPKTACAGMLQINPCHRASMKKWGLSFDSEADRLVYGCMLFDWHGYSPWSQVKYRAKRDLRKHFTK